MSEIVNSATSRDPLERPISRQDRPQTRFTLDRRWRIFLLLLVIGSVSYIDRVSISVGMPLIADEFGLNPQQQGYVLSAFFWTYAVFQIPGGWAADRYGPRRVIGSVMLLWAVIQTVTGLAANTIQLVVMRVFLGAAEAAQLPSGAKLSALWLANRERARGAALMNSSASLGSAFGGLLVGGLISWLGDWREAFIVVGAGGLAFALVAYWYLRDSPQEHPGVTARECDFIEAELEAEAIADADVLPEHPTSPINYLRQRTFWAMGLGWLSANLVFYGLLTFGPLYLYQERGLDIKTMAGAVFVMFGAGFVGENFAGWIAQRWRERGGTANVVMRTIFSISALGSTAAVVGVAYVPSAGAAVALLAVTLFFLRFMGLYWSLPATLAARRHVGIVGGMMNLFANIGGIAIPLITGAIVSATGSYFPALMMFAGAGIAYMLFSLSIDYSKKLPV
ncbi:MAG: MFS transporter [Mycobacterium sp.]